MTTVDTGTERSTALVSTRRLAAEGEQPSGLEPALLALRVDLLVSFAALARDLHFTKAARSLHLSQSGLSRRLVLLERCVGVSLVERSTRSVELTAAGRNLLPHALAILADVRAATDAISALRADDDTRTAREGPVATAC